MSSVFLGSTLFSQPTPESAQHGLALPPLPDAPSWTLLDGPPYANGPLHMGHVRNKLTKDTLARVHARSQNVTWQAGWDCHGLPVERNVEALGGSRSDPRAFVRMARDYATSQVNLQRDQLRSLYTSCDVDQPYLTMEPKQQANTLRVFARMCEGGHVYSAFKPVHWCCECQSTVANMESEELPLSSKDLYFMVALSDGNYAWVWTTQAWSLYYHDALLVHPSARYSLYRVEAYEEVRHVWMRPDSPVPAGWNRSEVLREVAGMQLEGLTYSLPWTDRQHMVMANQVVHPDAGTGWLHASAACAEEDYQALPVELRHSLQCEFMQSNGVLPVTQKMFYHTHQDVCAWYQAQQTSWSMVASVQRDRPHCWRHKTALTVRPAMQWYVRVDNAVKERALAACDQVQFVPAAAKARLQDALRHRPDWCVSRQRTWGVPLGVYTNDKGEMAPFAVQSMLDLAQAMETKGSEALWDLPVEREGYTLCMDVLDVWFDSGACFLTTTDSQVHCVVEGHDQHRGWFQSSMLVSAVLSERLPYKMVVSHGFVLDAGKQKLSKSVQSKSAGKMPVWSDVHPDVLRVWCVMGSVESDRLWDHASLTAAQKLVQKWRNTWRFCLANMGPWTNHLPASCLDAEHWMVYSAQTQSEQVLRAFSQGAFEHGTALLQTMCNELYSAHAFSMLKDRLYCGNADERQAAQAVVTHLAYYLRACLEVVLPCTMAESDAVAPVTLGAPALQEKAVHWDALYAWRLTAQNDFAPLSQKGAGTLAYASVARVHDGMLPEEDLLQWCGASRVHEEGRPLQLMKGLRCSRCRWVFEVPQEQGCPRCQVRGFEGLLEGSAL